MNLGFYSKPSQHLHMPSPGHVRIFGLWEWHRWITGSWEWCLGSVYQATSLSVIHHTGSYGCPAHCETNCRSLQVTTGYAHRNWPIIPIWIDFHSMNLSGYFCTLKFWGPWIRSLRALPSEPSDLHTLLCLLSPSHSPLRLQRVSFPSFLNGFYDIIPKSPLPSMIKTQWPKLLVGAKGV